MNHNFSKKTIKFFLISSLVFLFSSLIVFAVEDQAVLRLDRIREVRDNIWELSLYFVGIIAVGAIIYAGIRWATSAGDATAVGEAKKSILSVFVGLLIVMFSVYLLQFLEINIEPVLFLPDPVVVPDPVIEDPVFTDGIVLTKNIERIKEIEEEKYIHVGRKEYVAGGEINIRNLNRIVYNRELARMIIKNIEFKNPDEHRYGVILFERPNFTGECKIITQNSHPPFRPGSIKSFTMPHGWVPRDSILTFYNYPHDFFYGHFGEWAEPEIEMQRLTPIKKSVYLPTQEIISVVKELEPLDLLLFDEEARERLGYDMAIILHRGGFCPFSITAEIRRKHLIVLRNDLGECYLIQGSIANVRNLWWTGKISLTEELEIEMSCPISVEAVQVLRFF